MEAACRPRRGPVVILGAWLAACAAPPPEGTDPLAEVSFPALGPAEIAAGELPEGFRLGDPLYLDAPREGSGKSRARKDPAAGIFFAKAVGAGGEVALVQIAFPAREQLEFEEWLRRAGIARGEAVACMQVPETRDWMRLSQSHVTNKRYPAALVATSAPELYLIVRDGRVDSAVRTRDLGELARIEGASFAHLVAEVAAALRASELPRAQEAARKLEAARGFLPEGAGVHAEIDRALAALHAAEQAHDAPLLAELGAQLAELTPAWQAANALERAALYAQRAPALQRLVTALRGAVDQRRALERLASELRASAKAASARNDARGALLRWLAERSSAPEPALLAEKLAAAAALDAARGYEAALRERDRFAFGKERVPEPSPGFYGELVARAIERDARAASQQGRALSARFLESWAGYLRSSSFAEGKHAWPRREAVDDLANDLPGYERLGSFAERLRWIEERERVQRDQNGHIDQSAFENLSFLRTLRRELATPLRAEAESALAAGHRATAATHLLHVAVALRNDPSEPLELRALLAAKTAPHGELQRAAWVLAPVLAELLPALDAQTAQAERLAELLAEAPCASWPIVDLLALHVDPSRDLPNGAGRHAHLEFRDDGFALVELEQPQSALVAALAWERYSGLSPETREEARWLRTEREWLDAEEAALAPERAELARRWSKIESETTSFQARRARLSGAGSSEIEAFNRDAARARGELEDYKRREQAYNARVSARQPRLDEFNRRVGPYNERRMRELSAGGRALDEKLRRALLAFVTERLAAYEQAQRTERGTSVELERELAHLRWFLGQGGSGPALALDTRAEARLRCRAIERNLTRQEKHEEVAALVLSWWSWSARAGIASAERAERFADHASDFRWRRNLELLRRAVRDASLTSADRTHLERLLAAAAAETAPRPAR